ncbi:MAG: 30S ribosomal protein S6 [Chlamydiota bacterium]
MNKEAKNLYEGMFILSTTLSEDARQKSLERITSEIEERGGEIHKIHNQGRRKLAYEIQEHREGYYYLIYFSVAPAAITELWREYHLNEDLIRFITLRTNEVKETLEFKSLAEQ